MAYARGKYAKAISDRSGMAFPYKEMVKEWNGAFVHKSEFEPKHPQIKKKHITADPIALANARPRGKEDNNKFILYVNNGDNNSSMRVTDSNNILGTTLDTYEVSVSVGEVTITVS